MPLSELRTTGVNVALTSIPLDWKRRTGISSSYISENTFRQKAGEIECTYHAKAHMIRGGISWISMFVA